MKSFFIFLILIGLIITENCKKESEKISIDSFRKIPTEIDGCSCIFSENELKYNNREYLFASNFDSIGFISINNKIVKLKLTQRKYKANTVENEDYICTYKSDNYKVIVEIKADKTKKESEETLWNLGTIKVENEAGEKTEKKFVGESGC